MPTVVRTRLPLAALALLVGFAALAPAGATAGEVDIAMSASASGGPAPEDVCEFPAQSISLERDIQITNSAPQITEVATDICGNVLGYTESMSRNTQAGAWKSMP